ncbi:MAG: nucleotidyltransferase domain-containing protein [Proteobacteria bacterium]|jgi:predicted nucleotidyltransferase|nr:nucleotidyltransferase domain-containing protein [Pseudomonadota bacterium]
MPNKLFIEDKHFNIVLGILKKHLIDKNIKVYIFGSRSTGKNIKKGSDLDLALENGSGHLIDSKLLNQLDFEFEDSDLPYKVDLLDLNSAGQEFRVAIDSELTEILF